MLAQRTKWCANGACLVALVTAWAMPARAESSAAENANDPALREYLTGNGLLNRGLYELAVAEYRKFLQTAVDHPKAPLARYGLTVSLFRLSRFDEALTELDPLRQQADFAYGPEVWTIAGQCELSLKRNDAAVQSFRVVEQRFADHELADDAAAGTIEALFLLERHEEAALACKQFEARWPENPLRERVLHFWGLSLLELGRFSDAAEKFEAIVKGYPKGPFAETASLMLAQCLQRDGAADKAIEQYRRTLTTGGQSTPDALANLGSLLFGRRDYAEAAKTLDRLIEQFPNSPHLPQARLQRAQIRFEEGDFRRALAAFEGLTSSPPGDEAEFWAAKCELRLDDPQAAAHRLTRAVSKHPTSAILAEMTYDRAIALHRAQKYEDAIAGLLEFRKRFPEHELSAPALRLLATTQHQRGQYESSRSYCAAFVAEYPRHEAVVELAFLAAENDFVAGQLQRAADGFKHFIENHASDPQAAKAKFRLGLALFRLEQFDEAAAWLEHVASIAGEDALFRPALVALGDIHFHRGEWKQAEVRFTQYLKFDADVPSADDALLKLALCKQREERFDDALADYARLLDRFSSSPHRIQAMFEKGQCLAALKRLDDAVVAFEAVVAQGRDTQFAAHALSQLGAIAASRGQSDKAAEVYAKLAGAAKDDGLRGDAVFQQAQALMSNGRFADAESAYRSYLTGHPAGPRAKETELRLAIAIARQDRCAEALAAMKSVNPSAPELPSPLRAALAYEKGWCLLTLDRNEDAADAFRSVLKEPSPAPYDLHALLELGGLESKAGQFDRAVATLSKLRDALSTRSSEVAASVAEQCTYRLAMAHYELSQFEQAIALLDEFLSLYGKSALAPAASFYAGEAAYKLNRYEKAVAQFTRVVKEFKDDPVFAPTLLRLGECLAALQRWALSEQSFNTYLDRYPTNDAAYQAQFGLGWARENQKRFDEAIAAYSLVVAGHQGPTAARAQFQIGQCLFAQQKYEDAVRELLKVDILYAYPEWSAAALFEASRCFERLGKIAEARTHLIQVEEKFKDTQWAAMAAKRLSEMSSAVALPGR